MPLCTTKRTKEHKSVRISLTEEKRLCSHFGQWTLFRQTPQTERMVTIGTKPDKCSQRYRKPPKAGNLAPNGQIRRIHAKVHRRVHSTRLLRKLVQNGQSGTKGYKSAYVALNRHVRTKSDKGVQS
jgi:hypothetical protein